MSFSQETLFSERNLFLHNSRKPEDHWSCIAHLSAEDMLKSAIIEEKNLNIVLGQGQTTH